MFRGIAGFVDNRAPAARFAAWVGKGALVHWTAAVRDAVNVFAKFAGAAHGKPIPPIRAHGQASCLPITSGGELGSGPAPQAQPVTSSGSALRECGAERSATGTSHTPVIGRLPGKIVLVGDERQTRPFTQGRQALKRKQALESFRKFQQASECFSTFAKRDSIAPSVRRCCFKPRPVCPRCRRHKSW